MYQKEPLTLRKGRMFPSLEHTGTFIKWEYGLKGFDNKKVDYKFASSVRNIFLSSRYFGLAQIDKETKADCQK